METEQEVQKVEPTVEQEVKTPASEAVVTSDASAPAPVVSETEAQLAADALGSEQVVETPTVPVGVVHGLRAKGREKDQVIHAKDQLIERLQTELDTRNAPPPEISPLAQHAIENPGQEMSEVPVEITLADRKWRDQQAENKQTVSLQKQRQQASSKSLVNAQATLSDYDDVVAMGRRYLSDGNLLDIQSSADPAMKLYQLCIEETLKSGSQDAITLRQHLQSKVTQSSPKTVKPIPKLNDEEQQPEEDMSPRLAQTYAMLGM